ncbi:MAG: UDP-N-acetylmuramoyl-tripeptide--D-alanyl-D-alanine ligase [Blautia sp.]|nr:UDP-N-acetylmuramoyl-tripeptide--D-alanyl-D-alanine ligase [Blautia sp.]
MKNLTLDNIAFATGGVLYGTLEEEQKEVSSVTTDSRKVEPGCLFIPIVGERADGHNYIDQAAGKGALAVLSERVLEKPPCPYILVESSLQAVKDIAKFYLSGLSIPVVGVTGSVGKTSTKEAIASVLSQKYNTLWTEGNFNNELGLPLTIFRLREEHQIAVLEMGISDFGEMSRLADVARPSLAVITNIGTCHLENLGDREGVFRAKTELFAYVKNGGHVVLNGDDDKLVRLKDACAEEMSPDADMKEGSLEFRARQLGGKGIRPVFFGMGETNDVYADGIESRGLLGTTCRIHLFGQEFTVNIPIPGNHMVQNALAASAVGYLCGLTTEEIRAGLEKQQALGGRFRMVQTEKFLIVDDCYNANPMSMKASLNVLHDGGGRRVAVLGDMGELGKDEEELHRQVGVHAAECGIDLLICAGTLCRSMAEAAKEAAAARQKAGTAAEGAVPPLQVVYFPDRETLLRELPDYIEEKDTILVKASRFMKFEEVVEKLKTL